MNYVHDNLILILTKFSTIYIALLRKLYLMLILFSTLDYIFIYLFIIYFTVYVHLTEAAHVSGLAVDADRLGSGARCYDAAPCEVVSGVHQGAGTRLARAAHRVSEVAERTHLAVHALRVVCAVLCDSEGKILFSNY